MTNFSIRRPIFTIVVMVLFIIMGIVSTTRLPLQLIPDIDPPVAAVVTSYSSAGPDEVLSEVTEPIEEALATTSGLQTMQSNTTEGTSMVILQFDWDTSIDDVELDIINTLRSVDLPDDANEPSFLQFDPSMMPMMQLAVTSGDSIVDFQDDVNDLSDELLNIVGVASVDANGSLTEIVEISLDRDEMNDYNVTQDDVSGVIQANDVSMPGGAVEQDDLTLTTRVISEITTLDDIRELVVSLDPDSGDEITIDDLADVDIVAEDQTVITRANQEEAMTLAVMQESSANTSQTSNAVNERIDELLNDSDYDDLDIVSIYDEGQFINAAISSVVTALILGGVLAMAVLFLFLRNFKTPLIIGLAIPISIMVTFALMFFLDIGLNIMTLGGLALGIGLVVDNAIVVIENIYRHLSQGKDPKKAASEGTKEVFGAIVASTLTTVSVFLPIVFISGIVGDLFRDLALTVSFSLLSSLFVAITLVPMLASRVLKTPKEDVEESRRNTKTMRSLEKMTHWSLGHRKTVIGMTLLLLVGGVAGLSTVGTELLPESDQGTFTIEVEMETGTTLSRTDEAVERIEDVLNDYQEIADYSSTIGGTSMDMGGNGQSHMAEIAVSLVPADERTQSDGAFVESITRDLERADSDADVRAFTQSAAMGGEANTVPFTVAYSEREELYEFAEEVEEELLDSNLINEVQLSIEDTVPEVVIEVDDEAAIENGFTPIEIAQQVNEATRGETIGTVRIGEDEEDQSRSVYEVMVSLYSSYTESVSDLEELTITNSEGSIVTLDEVADITEGEGPAAIQRADQEEAVEFTVGYTTNAVLGDVSSFITQAIDDVELPDGAEFSFGGEQEILDDAIGSLILALVLAVIFIYLIMAAQFESFKLPFIMILTVPLVVIGVSIALTMTQTAIGITTFIGVIILVGIVVNNGIVMLDFVNQQKQKGLGTYDALVESVKLRTRPIVMTSVTAILGMVPIAIGIGEGAEMQQPMAIAVIGGLISSTLLTLVFIPVVYSLFDKETRHLRGRPVIVEHGDGESQRYLRSSHDRVNGEWVEAEDEQQDHHTDASDESQEKTESESQKENDDLSKDEILHLLEHILKKNKKDSDKE
ncbi:efflux RND transporter permease subunit [Shouchella patagoniensis]|uniref:efflux RND transporter permease subunit n=1 Tax=Shouchella patagoniensis TaxID=228576 RepID=UPI0009955778|nr:efflux RND transporter permease subunit [Shouchella patagoniensis]